MRGYTTFTTPRAAVLAILITAALLVYCCTMPMAAVNAVWFCQMALPYLLLAIGTVAGFAPMAACTAIALYSLFYVAGLWGIALGALYILPLVFVYSLCLTRRIPFFKTCGVITGALFIGQLAVYLILQRLAGGNLYAAAADLSIAALDKMTGRDTLLYLLYQSGFLAVPVELTDSVYLETVGGVTFTKEVLNEFYSYLHAAVESYLKNYVPASLVSHSLLAGVGGTAIAIRMGRRKAQRRAYKRNEPEMEIPDLGMPEFSRWVLPRTAGLQAGLLVIGYPLALYTHNATLQLAGAMMFQAFTTVFLLQGMASVNWFQKKRGQKPVWQKITLSLIFIIVQFVLVVIGVCDQLFNIRGLRQSPPHATSGRDKE